MSRIRRAFLGNMFMSLALVLGLMQALVLHWFWVMLARQPAPSLSVWAMMAIALVALGGLTYSWMRRARRSSGLKGSLARGYMSFGVCTLLLGAAVCSVWLLAWPSTALMGALGWPAEEATQVLRGAANLFLLVVVGFLLWGVSFGQSRIQHTRVQVPVQGLHESLEGLRIVQISDLHIGNRMEDERLDRLVDRVNALEPDLIAMTGDLFDFDPIHIEGGSKGLSRLRARNGVFAVLGNHDTYAGSERVADALATHAPNVRLLRGEIESLGLSAPLHMAGVDDPGHMWNDRELILDDLETMGSQIPADGPTILLVHRPDAFGQAVRLGFSMVLSGHTHGGQIAVPGLARRFNLARIISRYPQGLFRDGGVHLYVNRGAGVAGPAIRIAAPREITTLELRPS